MKLIPRVRDIIFHEDFRGKKSILYVMDYDLENNKYIMAAVTVNTCSRLDISPQNFEGLTYTEFIDNYDVPEMEIMNLSNVYPEKFI